VNGAVVIAAGFSVVGNVAATGAITVGAGATLLGCATAGGAITEGAGGTIQCGESPIPAGGASGGSYALTATFGGILIPGTYTIGAASAANTAVQLNCENSPTSAFNFVIGGALSLNANVLTVNGPCQVQWTVNGAVTIAAGFTVVGNITATGAVSLAAGATLEGCALAVGALTFGAGATQACSSNPIGPFTLPAVFSGTLVPGAYGIGAAAAANTPVSLDCQGNPQSSFAFTIGGALSFNANVLTINGPCNVNWAVNGAVTLAAGVQVTGSISATGAISFGAGATLNGCALAVGAVTFGAGASQSCGTTSVSNVLPAVFSGTLSPGTYTIGAAAADNSPVSLDCQSNPNSVFNFVIGGALNVNANIASINGPCTVNWAVNGAVTIAAGVSMVGDISSTGAITVGAGATLNGCANPVGALTVGAGASIQCGTIVSTSYALSPTFSGTLAPGSYSAATATLASVKRGAHTASAPAPINFWPIFHGPTWAAPDWTCSNTIQLDCQHSASSVFRFSVASLTLSDNVQMINGNCQVHWQVVTASIGSGLNVDGNFDASSSLTVGANTHINGYCKSSGNISLGEGTTVLYTQAVSVQYALPALIPSLLTPGTYTTAAAVAANTPVQLNCEGSPNSAFYFVIGGALSINANVVTINGPCYVHWAVTGAVSVAANFNLAGNIDATGAISLGANVHLLGCPHTAGLLTIGSMATVQCTINQPAPCTRAHTCSNHGSCTILGACNCDYDFSGAVRVLSHAMFVPVVSLYLTWLFRAAISLAAFTACQLARKYCLLF
jgi:cytoskeletal protein CcmA (bactofilin family)